MAAASQIPFHQPVITVGLGDQALAGEAQGVEAVQEPTLRPVSALSDPMQPGPRSGGRSGTQIEHRT